MAISTTPEKLQQVGDEIGEQPNISSIPFIYIENAKLKLRNVYVSQNLLSGSNSFIFGHPTNGKFGVATGLGGGQIVFGQSGSNVITEVVRRRYDWETTGELSTGTR